MRGSRVRWSSLFAAICVLLSTLSVVIWGMIALHRSLARHLDSTIGITESKGMEHLTIFLTITFMILIGIGLAITFVKFDVFNPAKRKSEIYWLYFTGAVLICFLFLQIGSNYLYGNEDVRLAYARHPVYQLANARACLVVVLLLIGIAIYIVKYHSKLIYGLAEVIAAIASNIAIIIHVDLASFPKGPFHDAGSPRNGRAGVSLQQGDRRCS